MCGPQDAAVPDAIPLDLFDYNASSYESYYRNANILRAALDAVDLSSAGIDPDNIAVGQLEANFSLLCVLVLWLAAVAWSIVVVVHENRDR